LRTTAIKNDFLFVATKTLHWREKTEENLQDSVFMSIFVADYTKHFSLMVKRLLLFFLLTGCFAVARAQWKGLLVWLRGLHQVVCPLRL
jgi:hypothetical protein